LGTAPFFCGIREVGVKNTRVVDFLTGIVLMLLAAYWFIEASKMPKVELGIGPGGYPMFVSSVLFFLGFLMTVLNIRKGLPRPAGKIDRKAALRVIIFVAVSFVYVRAMRYLGFLLLTPPYIFFACCFFQYRKKHIAAIASVVVTAVLYIVFRKFFFVPLPVFRLF
jgi:hypothetical protein